MDSKKQILRECLFMTAGVGLCTALMVGVFALIGKFQLSVVWGGLAGWLLTGGNFFLLSITASLAADRAQSQDVAEGQKLMRSSQILRFLGLAAALILLGLSGLCHPIALVLPLIFLRPVLMIGEFFSKERW